MKASLNKTNTESEQVDLEEEQSISSGGSDVYEKEHSLDDAESGLDELSGSNEEKEQEDGDESEEDDSENDKDDDENDEDVTKDEPGKKHKLSFKNGNGPKAKKPKINKNNEKSNVTREKPTYDDPEVNARTIYVSNIPITCHHLKVKSFFSKYGKVEYIAARGAPSDIIKAAQKLKHLIEKLRGPDSSYFCYIRYKKREQAERAAVEGNGKVLYNNHLMVKLHGDNTFDYSKAIFINNIPFDAREEDLWKTFEHLGVIQSVHIKRDNITKKSRGLGYINFKNSDSVAKALEMANVKIRNRLVHVLPCTKDEPKNDEETKTLKKIKKPDNSKKIKRTENYDGEKNNEFDKEINKFKKTLRNDSGGKKIITKTFKKGIIKKKV